MRKIAKPARTGKTRKQRRTARHARNKWLARQAARQVHLKKIIDALAGDGPSTASPLWDNEATFNQIAKIKVAWDNIVPVPGDWSCRIYAALRVNHEPRICARTV